MSETIHLSNGGKLTFKPEVGPDERKQVLADFEAQGITAAEPPSLLGGLRRSVERGATLGLGDEVNALGQATGQQISNLFTGESRGFWDTYDSALGQNRAEMRADRDKTGVGGAVAEGVGGLASLPVGAAAKAFGATQAGARAAPAVSRFGVQPQSAMGRLSQSVTGAAGKALGGGATATGGMGARVAQAAGVGASNAALVGFAEGEGGAMDRLDNAAVGALFGAGGGAAIGGLMEGMPRLGRLLFGPRDKNVPRHSAAVLMSAFEKDGFSRQQALDAITKWQRSGSEEVVLADIGGPAVKRLARSARSASPAASSQADSELLSRHINQNERIQDATRDATGARGDQVYEAIQELAERRSAEARPLYENLFDQQAPWSDWFKQATENPRIRSAIAAGRELQRDEALARGGDMQQAWAVTAFAEDGSPILGNVPTVRDWDAAKRGLDRLIEESGRDPKTWRLNQRGVALDKLRRRLIEELDARIPGYSDARQAWGDPSEAIEMAGEGRNVFKRDPEQIARTLAGLRNDQNAEYYRIGVARALEDKLDAVRNSRDATLIFNAKMWKQIRAALGDEPTSRLQASIAREANMADTLNVVSRGSQTQDKMADALMLAQPESMAGVTDFMRGDVRGGAIRQALEFANRRSQGVTEKVGEQLGAQMFTPAASAQNVAGGVRKSARDQVLEALQRAQSERQLGAGAGRIAGLLAGP